MSEQAKNTDTDDGEKLKLLALLGREFARIGEPARIGDGLWLANWRNLRLTLDFAAAAPADARPDQQIARIDMTFTFNIEHPDTAIATRAVGLGSDRDAALASAVHGWMFGTAPALISHMYGELRHGAEYSPDGDILGIPGWNVISGPYLLTGAESAKRDLANFVQGHPLIAPVRDRLACSLEKNQRYHSVVLYRAMAGSAEFTELLIDNCESDLAELLRNVALPQSSGGFAAVRQFLLCCRSG